MPHLELRLARLCVVAEIALLLLVCHDIAYVTTYRLFLNHRVDNASRSAAAQRFDIEGSRVVPQIVARGDDRMAFSATLGRPSTLHVDVRPAGAAHYEIHWRNVTADRMLARGDVAEPTAVVIPVPAENGVVELMSRGSLTWIDPRLVRDLRIGRHVAALITLFAASLTLARRRARRHGPAPSGSVNRIVWFRRFALGTSIFVSLVTLEVGLRALGDRVPPGIAVERHDLGEVRKDPRWVDTLRYGRRLRARVDATNEWRYGDIVRMGYVPAATSDGLLHRFRFQTDTEGFRNVRVRERIDIAALGDSFTDAMTLDTRDGWTSLLERRSGLAVQNYGTAGFGPQQELRVLTDFALRHRPRIVVLAYFAGNDLFDAEAFDDFDRSRGAIQRPVQGWRIKDVVSRADTWFLVSALRAAGAWTSQHQRAEASPMPAAVPVATSGDTAPGFDRGMFTLTVQQRALRFAFMPPYLNTLNFSEQDLEARRGWALTSRAILDMRDAARGAGAELVVMFLPFKSQIYLPLVEQAIDRAELSRALQFYLPDTPSPDVTAMLRNRLAQNRMLQRLCAAGGIRFLDTTPALDARLRSGENVYFPDESHLNETGHAVVAEALARFLGR